MLEPWAVAYWSDQASSQNLTSANYKQPFRQQGEVTVHADPDSDITLAATTKMTAIPATRPGTNSDKRNAVNAGQSPQGSISYGLRRPPFTPPTPRELDPN